jgi:dolichol-phosphate mannosyltransferase
MTDVDIPVDTGDFRLIDRKVCDALKEIPEHNRYVRGLVSWLGFKQTGVEFVREERFAGTTKYPLRKMLRFATDALASFSYKPLKFAAYIGGLISAISLAAFVVLLFEKLLSITQVPGWTMFAAVILLINGLMLAVLGILGEYIGRIYDEAKGRPLYIIGEKAGFDMN